MGGVVGRGPWVVGVFLLSLSSVGEDNMDGCHHQH